MNQVTVNVGTLAEDAGLTVRTIQHWSDVGVLRPTLATRNQGKGKHKEFDASAPYFGERTWARIAGRLAQMGAPVGNIKLIIDRMRVFSTDWIEDGLAKKAPHVSMDMLLSTDPVGLALLGRAVILAVAVDDNKEVMWCQALNVASPDDVKKETVWSAEHAARIGLPGEKFTTFDEVEVRIPYEFIAEFPAFYMLNLSLILKPLVDEKAKEA